MGVLMMKSSNGNIFRVTGHLCGEFTGLRWRGALILSLICVWINSWVNNSKTGDLRRYRVHYDVSVMVGDPMSPPGTNFSKILTFSFKKSNLKLLPTVSFGLFCFGHWVLAKLMSVEKKIICFSSQARSVVDCASICHGWKESCPGFHIMLFNADNSDACSMVITWIWYFHIVPEFVSSHKRNDKW